MEATKEKTLEELKQTVLIRERDLAEAFSRWRSLSASVEKEPSESARLEIWGRARTIEALVVSAAAKLINSYRAYSAALETELRR